MADNKTIELYFSIFAFFTPQGDHDPVSIRLIKCVLRNVGKNLKSFRHDLTSHVI